MQTLLIFMSILNLLFYPLVIGFFVALIIEQIFRAQDKVPQVLRSMAIRKYMWRQAWIVNILWFLGYIIVMIMVRGQAQPQMPDMIWEG